eukprot:4360442-Prorocentrum_lima.AAC.1
MCIRDRGRTASHRQYQGSAGQQSMRKTWTAGLPVSHDRKEPSSASEVHIRAGQLQGATKGQGQGKKKEHAGGQPAAYKQ